MVKAKLFYPYVFISVLGLKEISLPLGDCVEQSFAIYINGVTSLKTVRLNNALETNITSFTCMNTENSRTS